MLADRNRANLKTARPYGCLFAIALFAAMSFVIFLGNVMGDCASGSECHDNDGAEILSDLAVALSLALLMGVAMWLLASVVQSALRDVMPEIALKVSLVMLTLLLVWFSFDPAFEAFFELTA